MKRRTSRSASPWKFLEPRAPLDLKTFQAAVQRDATNLRPWVDQMTTNQKTRDCVWPGQTPDGRVHKSKDRPKPWPFENASDARLPVVDGAIQEQKAFLKATKRAAKLEVEGLNANNDQAAALVTPVLNYVLNHQMRGEASEQSELMADYALDHGLGFLHIDWLERREIEEAEIRVNDLLGIALQLAGATPPADDGAAFDEDAESEAGQGMEEAEAPQPAAGDATAPGSDQQALIEQHGEDMLWDMLLNPDSKAQFIGLLQKYDTAMTAAEAERVVSQLKRDESATYFRPYVAESRPFWEALCLGVDITLPPSSLRDIQMAPRVTRWKWLSEADLYDMGTAQGWDKEVLDMVAANPGAMWQDWQTQNMPNWMLGTMGVGQSWTHEDAREARLYQIAITWHRMPTKAGPSVLFKTIHHGCSPDKPLYHGVMKDAHGTIPIRVMRRQNRSKLLVQSSGLSQSLRPFQDSLKLRHDAGDNNLMLRTTPPMEVPVRRFGQDDDDAPLPISPFCQIQVPQIGGQASTLKFLPMPDAPVDAAQERADLRTQMNRYAGLADSNVPSVVVQTLQQDLADNWLAVLNEALNLTFQLCQQYMDPITGATVAGMAVPLHATKEQIRGQFQFKLGYDPRDLDLDYLAKKFKLLSEMLQFDSTGVVKRGELMKYVFSAADPVLAQRLVFSDDDAVSAAAQDEQAVIAAQVAGQRPTGRFDSPQSRLQVHEEWFGNPQTLQRLHVDPQLLQVELARVKTLEFQVEQTTTNRTTGRTGEAAQAPWEQGQKLSERIEATFGIGTAPAPVQPQPALAA